MIVAAIDSAETSGVAVVERAAGGAERLIRHGVLRVDTAADVERVAGELAADRADLYAIEQPFLHGPNPAAGLLLATLFGRWRQALERRGLATVVVPTEEWQLSGLLAGITRTSRGADRKLAARAFVMATYRVLVDQDAADAVCLATWVARSGRAQRRCAG